jgi:signal transduction histidine kinase
LIERADQDGIVLVDLPAGQTQRRVAFAIALALLGSAAAAAPFASVQLRQFDAFIPVSQTFICVNDLITSVLLISQFVIIRWRAILVLASGYLFTALVDVTQLLTFPGTFTPTGLLGAGLQTTGWLYEFWHSGFPIAVIFYVMLKNQAPETRVSQQSTRTAVATSVAAVIAIVLGLSWLATAGDQYLPRLFLDRSRQTPAAAFFSGLVFLLSAVALLMLWFRRRSVLDLWLMVAMCAWLLDIFIQTLAGSRFTLGFYASRVYALITATVVLVVLLWETMTLYARLAVSVFAQRRERESRMMTMEALAAAIAHEVKQPLGGVVSSANAALRWLDRPGPDLHQARASLERIVSDSHRAAQVLDSIRSLFPASNQEKSPLFTNALIREVLELAGAEFRAEGVVVLTELAADLPMVVANKVQLQEVILNLVTNAIQAMRPVTHRARVLKVSSTFVSGQGVLIAVEDSGTGIDPKNIEGIFDPFFTTKPHGTGMGLAICRSIIETHDGKLWVTQKGSEGVIFQFTVPVDGGQDLSSSRAGAS